MEILRQPQHVARELRRMNRYGVLRRYWPDFAKVVGMMQYDLFHIHPVDEHTLRVLTELRHITKTVREGENPLYRELFLQFPKPELLYLRRPCSMTSARGATATIPASAACSPGSSAWITT